jgi:hypothetical protein
MIYNYLLSLFNYKNNEHTEINTDTKKQNNSILFYLDQNQKINLDIDIDNISADDAKQFGLLLFLINEGYYVQSFLDIISDIAKKHSDKTEFVQTVISTWSNAIIENDKAVNQEDPIIKPTQFNIASKNNV